MRKAFLTLTLCAGCTLGQTINGSDKHITVHVGDAAEFGPLGITTALAGPLAVVTGAPYSAVAVTQRVQLLPDGNRIEQTSSGSVARDSQGRIRRDEALPGLTSGSGESPHIVMIDDPVAQVHWTLDARNKTAIKAPSSATKNGVVGLFDAVPPTISSTQTFFYSTTDGPTLKGQSITKSAVAVNDSSTTKTDLGKQTIEGVQAQGTRITRVIPAKQVGNDLPITITTEKWYSPELKVLVMSKTNDPRMGETTYRLTELQRSEPAASLFQPPDDYSVKDGAQTFVFRQQKQ